ncbi:hypothetical protein QR680_007935 [Steinernema hermaphroditum]|uniref:Uncharacterized protein n=1 Tax=Steinernema hermaphroditum TaxID=289476 RepID=A0AA39IEQ5_9BILA|nr:hypothetical protein QR680_007935 [Steinernema hermaphroditum]
MSTLISEPLLHKSCNFLLKRDQHFFVGRLSATVTQHRPTKRTRNPGPTSIREPRKRVVGALVLPVGKLQFGWLTNPEISSGCVSDRFTSALILTTTELPVHGASTESSDRQLPATIHHSDESPSYRAYQFPTRIFQNSPFPPDPTETDCQRELGLEKHSF